MLTNQPIFILLEGVCGRFLRNFPKVHQLLSFACSYS